MKTNRETLKSLLNLKKKSGSERWRVMRSRVSSTPLRMCAACRVRREKEELIRFCPGADGGLEIDLMGIKPGRGVYLCPDSKCIDGAVKNDAFGHGFKGKVEVKEIEGLGDKILTALKSELKRLLSISVDLDSEADVADVITSLSQKKKAERARKLWYKYRSLRDSI